MSHIFPLCLLANLETVCYSGDLILESFSLGSNFSDLSVLKKQTKTKTCCVKKISLLLFF